MEDEKGQHTCGICGGSLDSGDHSACQSDDAEPAVEKKFELTRKQKAGLNQMILYLSWGDMDSALEIKEEFSLPEAETQSAVKQVMIKKLSRGDVYDALALKGKSTLPEHVAQSAELQSAAKKAMIIMLLEGQITTALEIERLFSLPEAEAQSAVMQAMIKKLTKGRIDDALALKGKFTLPEQVTQSAELQSAVKQAMIKKLTYGQIDDALALKGKFTLPEQVTQSAELQSEAKKAMIKELSWGNIYDVLRIKREFSLPEEFLQSAEVQSAVKQAMIKKLTKERIDGVISFNIDDARKLNREFSLPEEFLQSAEVQPAVMQFMIKELTKGRIAFAFAFKEEFHLPEEFLQSAEVQSAAKQGMIENLSEGKIDDALKIKEKFSLPEQVTQSAELQSAVMQAMIKKLTYGRIEYDCSFKIDHALKIKEKFSLPESEAQSVATQAIIAILSKVQIDYALKIIDYALKIKEKFSLPDQKVQEPFCNFIENAISENNLHLVLPHLDRFPSGALKQLEPKYFLSSYRNDLNLASVDIYTTYRTLKQAGDEMQITGFIEKMKDSMDSFVSSHAQDSGITEMEHYQTLIEIAYPNHADNWTNFRSNESCADRSADIEHFAVRDKYIVDLSEGVDMVLAPGQTKDGTAVADLERPIAGIQQKFSEVGFDKEKMFGVLDKEIDEKIANVPQKEIFTSREEKLYGLLLESLVGKANPEDLKELLIGYQFAEFEDIKAYLEGTRAQAEQAKNPDYAYLLELREFFADHLKEVERKIAKEAEGNPDIAKRLPDYYQKKRILDADKGKQETLNRLQISKLGLDGNLLERIAKELGKKTDSKGNPFSLGDRDDDGNLVPGKKSEALAGMIMAEQRKAAKAIVALTGEEVDPESVHLGELNLAEYLDAQHMLKNGEYDEELFSRYLLQAFQGIFEKELTTIDREVAKYKPKDEELRGKKQKKLECFITKNHTSAHARGVGGVCVSGDNPINGSKNQWDMPNYFQMVLRDAESKVCQGLVLLHYYEDNGKKILTASLNPSSTYLYQVDEQQLFKGLLKQLEVFATDNGIDAIAISQNKSMRTNRTGGEFERAMDNRIRSVQKTESLTREETFSYHPNYTQQKLDVVWQKGVE